MCIRDSPYGVPINYIYDDGKIYIHSAVEGHKLRNFEHDSHVSFCVVAEAELLQEDVNTMFKSVIAFGKMCIRDRERRMSAGRTEIKRNL